MSEKEKVSELIESFRKILGISIWYLKNNPADFKRCKKCVHFVCDEFIKEGNKEQIIYWSKVKTEIENIEL